MAAKAEDKQPGSGKSEVTVINPKVLRDKDLRASGLPPEIVRLFTSIRIRDPYKLKGYGGALIEQCVADKLIDFPLHEHPENKPGEPPKTRKMQAILCCNLSKSVGSVRIACPVEENEPTCMIWYFEQCHFKSYIMVNNDGSTTDTGKTKMNKTQHTVAVNAILQLIG